MVIYEVNLAVDAVAADELAAWLAPHIQQMLTFEGFERAEWFDIEPERAETTIHWCIHYHVQSRDDLQRYFDEGAAQMRGDGVEKFGRYFRANRRILKKGERPPIGSAAAP